MIKSRDFCIDDLENFTPRSDISHNRDQIEFLRELDSQPWCKIFTILINNKIMCFAGGWFVNEKTVEVFCVASELVKKHFVSFIRYFSSQVNFIAKSLGVNRVQCIINGNIKCAQKYARSLGFSIEGEMKKYCIDGSSAYLCARVFSWAC